ncbi:MAG: hypothetical protein LBB78_01635 [Spirochaetaceae bacterium]|jgi:hypothetical protein|nr:hypothetical protein [Spirochaetaceae bacterium]
MTVVEYTVSDENGNVFDANINDENGNIIIAKNTGKIVKKPDDPFVFYVKNPAQENAALEVKIVMPLGGAESGLFRYPRVGEMVLVGTENADRYLMGYIPTYTHTQGNPPTQDFQTDGMDQDDGRGEVFRYQQTGKTEENAEEEEYSEIGFYHQETAWKPGKTEAANYADAPDGYPLIDRINIHSTGDIHENAVNHHQIRAKRFELLADCGDINHKTNTVIDEATGQDTEDLPLGDHPGDDSELHGGDVHIRAGNRVVIKAEEEIQLQVGRTVLTIKDGGFNVTYRMLNSNFSTSYDASLDLSRDGVSTKGKKVEIGAVNELGISDAMGGSLSSNLGVVEIKGRELQIEAYDSSEFIILELGLAFKFLQAMTALGLHQNNPDRDTVGEVFSLTNNFLADISTMLKEIADLRDDLKQNQPSNP